MLKNPLALWSGTVRESFVVLLFPVQGPKQIQSSFETSVSGRFIAMATSVFSWLAGMMRDPGRDVHGASAE